MEQRNNEEGKIKQRGYEREPNDLGLASSSTITNKHILNNHNYVISTEHGFSKDSFSKSYTGLNQRNGKLINVREFHIKYSKIQTKCASKCYWLNKIKCNGHDVNDFIDSVKNYVEELSQMNHKNLVPYDFVECSKGEDGVTVYLVQHLIKGTSLSSITNIIGYNSNGIRNIAKDILKALECLQNHGFSHGSINAETIFLYDCGDIKCTDYSLIPHLNKLVKNSMEDKIEDLPALGYLIENLNSNLPEDIKKFVDKCKMDQTLSAYELVNYPFEYNVDNTLTLNNQPTFKSEFESLKSLKSGGFGVIFKARRVLDKRTYAVKKILIPFDDKVLKTITREIALLCQLQHENVVRYFNSWIENTTTDDVKEFSGEMALENENFKTKIQNTFASENLLQSFNQIMYIQMEFCEGSTIREAIDNNLLCGNIEKMWKMFREILQGLKYIHSKGIIHRDLKPGNIFLDSKHCVKIGDFGLATINSSAIESEENESNSNQVLKDVSFSTTFQLVGTRLYIAPELLTASTSSVYTDKVDMYALGIILFEMSKPPFNTQWERIDTINVKRNQNFVLAHEVVSFSTMELEEQISNTIDLLLQYNVKKRPTAEQLLNTLNVDKIGEIAKHIQIAYNAATPIIPKIKDYLIHESGPIKIADAVLSNFPEIREQMRFIKEKGNYFGIDWDKVLD